MNQWHDEAQPERAYFECSIDELADLRSRVLGCGRSEAFANSLVGWIVGADSAGMSNRTRADYRKVLRELGEPPKRRRGGRKPVGAGRQRGAASLDLVGAVAGAGATVAISGALCGHVAALASLAPIILGRSTDERHTAVQRLCDIEAVYGVAS